MLTARRDVEKSNAAALKTVGAAKAKVAAIERATADLADELSAAAAARKEFEGQVKQAEQGFKEAQNKAKAALAGRK